MESCLGHANKVMGDIHYICISWKMESIMDIKQTSYLGFWVFPGCLLQVTKNWSHRDDATVELLYDRHHWEATFCPL